jgi:hypothetical protein
MRYTALGLGCAQAQTTSSGGRAWVGAEQSIRFGAAGRVNLQRTSASDSKQIPEAPIRCLDLSEDGTLFRYLPE